MNIVHQKWIFFQRVALFAPKQINKLFCFGLEVLTLQPIQSLRANARLSSFNWHTAKMKMYRLCSNEKIARIFPCLLKHLGIVRENDVVAVDFSDFGSGFQVLMFAKQTKKGRAIPLYFEILRYPITRVGQNPFIIEAIQHFAELLGFKPILVFDRGFACPAIIQFLSSNDYKFICRVKKCKSFREQQTRERFLAKDSQKDDLLACAYERNLRLLVSDKPNSTDEPWYLVTNDSQSSREKIIEMYYHRFEIEEFFRDAKRLLGLEYINFKTERTLACTLWFTMLTMWFFWEAQELLTENDRKARKAMELSFVRYCLEQLHKQILHAAQLQFLPLFELSMAYEKV